MNIDPKTHLEQPLSGPDKPQYRLYVADRTSTVKTAITNARKLCDRYFGGVEVLEIIDLREDPDRADEDRVIAVPTLIRIQPPPSKRIIGDLSDTERVLSVLGLADDVDDQETAG